MLRQNYRLICQRAFFLHCKTLIFPNSIKKEGKVLIIKTDVRGQLAQIEYKSIETIVIDDVTCFKVKYKTMSISNNEEWEFEILN